MYQRVQHGAGSHQRPQVVLSAAAWNPFHGPIFALKALRFVGAANEKSPMVLKDKAIWSE